MVTNHIYFLSNNFCFAGVEVPSKDSVPKKRPIYEDKKKKKQQQPENKEGVVCIWGYLIDQSHFRKCLWNKSANPKPVHFRVPLRFF